MTNEQNKNKYNKDNKTLTTPKTPVINISSRSSSPTTPNLETQSHLNDVQSSNAFSMEGFKSKSKADKETFLKRIEDHYEDLRVLEYLIRESILDISEPILKNIINKTDILSEYNNTSPFVLALDKKLTKILKLMLDANNHLDLNPYIKKINEYLKHDVSLIDQIFLHISNIKEYCSYIKDHNHLKDVITALIKIADIDEYIYIMDALVKIRKINLWFDLKDNYNLSDVLQDREVLGILINHSFDNADNLKIISDVIEPDKFYAALYPYIDDENIKTVLINLKNVKIYPLLHHSNLIKHETINYIQTNMQIVIGYNPSYDNSIKFTNEYLLYINFLELVEPNYLFGYEFIYKPLDIYIKIIDKNSTRLRRVEIDERQNFIDSFLMSNIIYKLDDNNITLFKSIIEKEELINFIFTNADINTLCNPLFYLCMFKHDKLYQHKITDMIKKDPKLGYRLIGIIKLLNLIVPNIDITNYSKICKLCKLYIRKMQGDICVSCNENA